MVPQISWLQSRRPILRGRMAEQSIEDRERYVGFATYCLQLAKMATDLESRALLKEMAAGWGALALNRFPPQDFSLWRALLTTAAGSRLPPPCSARA